MSTHRSYSIGYDSDDRTREFCSYFSRVSWEGTSTKSVSDEAKYNPSMLNII